jgi:hypothetical protein
MSLLTLPLELYSIVTAFLGLKEQAALICTSRLAHHITEDANTRFSGLIRLNCELFLP